VEHPLLFELFTWGDLGRNVASIVGSLLIAYVLVRSRTSSILREERDALRDKCARIEEEDAKLKEEGHAKDVIIADLRAKTDLEVVKAQMTELQRQVAQEAAESRVTIVGMIQSVSKSIMEGFTAHVEKEQEFQQRVSDNFALTATILDDIQRRQAAYPR
jgi:hypothetical protein